MNPEVLHSKYVALTRMPIAWSMGRLYAWEAWLTFRKPAFTPSDLEMVVRHIQRGIRDGSRNPGALKFSNLIGNPERFEEDLAEALALSRRPRDTDRESVMRSTGRQPNGEQPKAVKVDEILNSEAFQNFCRMKDKL